MFIDIFLCIIIVIFINISFIFLQVEKLELAGLSWFRPTTIEKALEILAKVMFTF